VCSDGGSTELGTTAVASKQKQNKAKPKKKGGNCMNGAILWEKKLIFFLCFTPVSSFLSFLSKLPFQNSLDQKGIKFKEKF